MHMEMSGEIRVRSWFLDNYFEGQKTSEFVDQRLRLTMDWGIAENVSLKARADVLEGFWGDSLGAFGESPSIDPVTGSIETSTEFFELATKEEIVFDSLYGTVSSPDGDFILIVGRKGGGNWGFGLAGRDDTKDKLQVKYRRRPLYFEIMYDKLVESFADNIMDDSIGDNHGYGFDVLYATGDTRVGLLLYHQDNDAEVFPQTGINLASVYVSRSIGGFQLKSEVVLLEGELHLPDLDLDLSGRCAYGGLSYRGGPFAIGAEVAWARGDDPETMKIENAMSFDYDSDFHSLILFNHADYDGYGQLTSKADDRGVSNALAFKLSASMIAAEKLNVGMSLVYAERDETEPGTPKDLGWEFDLNGTYALHDNVTYGVGVGHLWAGDHFGDGENPWLVVNSVEIKF